MAWKPTFPRQRLLEFPPDPGITPERQSNVNLEPDGGHDALQNHNTGTLAGSFADLRPAFEDTDVAGGTRHLRDRAEEQAPGLEGSLKRSETGETSYQERRRRWRRPRLTNRGQPLNTS